ncbi:hypothetical protein FCT18_13555 [Lysinibacillus sphaericus]|uniref:Uncharacterized protein n=4 Tax=Lysinibacillus TaxID=400634 RepID=A0A2S5CVJ8_LYSSH|nr:MULTISPECIES: hypothetical protein [Lysinibacillus]AHN23569.1 hypothetical protein T479_21825 [Lysinibacillus varians]AVK95188.1 hypothetical protein LS41612_02195 [Lysinibacillus sphaericus]MCS1381715.1 hypothetical protein [Lysinibacillus sphaericus]MED4545177.1 hypothetical protein [Lysinibacillus sphaericus]OEC03647.1 hypothetical protein GY31_00050 [Lysinibacillus sphaericus]
MSGKKLVGIVIVVLVIACLFSVFTIQNFYKNNQEQPNSENREINKSKSLNLILPQATIISNSR